jgi:hypothetical protein
VTELIIFICVCILLGWGLHLWRKREQAAFHEVDVRALHEMRQSVGAEDQHDSAAPPIPGEPSLAIAPLASVEVAPRVYSNRQAVLDDIHRAFFQALSAVISKELAVLVQIPLAALIRSEKRRDPILRRTVSFAVYDKASFRPLCAVVLLAAAPSEVQRLKQLEDVCTEAGLPLLSFPMLETYAGLEIEEALKSAGISL